MTRKTRKYTNEFKQEAVHLALKSASIDGTVKELGISTATFESYEK